ncbi:MAG: hypothetical protein ABR551_01090 [Gemmatimonadales bacterium]
MDFLLVVLRLVHIVLGSVWVGIVVFNTLFLAPVIGELGPDGGKVMGALQKRGMLTFLPIISLITLLSGVWLLWKVSLGFNEHYFHTAAGHTFAGGGAMAILAYLIGIIVMRPSMLHAGTLAQGMAQVTDETERRSRQQQIQALRSRARISGQVVAALLVVSTAAMAVGRYL